MDEIFVKNFNDFSNSDKKMVLEKIKESLENNGEIDEGLMAGLVGAITGATLGPKLGDAICKGLGITTGPLYTMLHSRAFLSVVFGYMGWKY